MGNIKKAEKRSKGIIKGVPILECSLFKQRAVDYIHMNHMEFNLTHGKKGALSFLNHKLNCNSCRNSYNTIEKEWIVF